MDTCHLTTMTNENAVQNQQAGLAMHLPASVSHKVMISILNYLTSCFTRVAQICATPPVVDGSTSQVIVSSADNNALTVNTTITYTCPDNSTQTATCSYLPVGGAQWTGTLKDCETSKCYTQQYS